MSTETTPPEADAPRSKHRDTGGRFLPGNKAAVANSSNREPWRRCGFTKSEVARRGALARRLREAGMGAEAARRRAARALDLERFLRNVRQRPAEEQMRLHADVDRAHEKLEEIERDIASGSPAHSGKSELDRMLDGD